MDFKTSQKLYSNARMGKYLKACTGNQLRTMQLYRYNLRKGKNQADIYLDLTHIREFRNRIAHHEPICFDGNGNICTDFARKHYQLICDYIGYFGQNPNDVISWAETPDFILDKIEKLSK